MAESTRAANYEAGFSAVVRTAPTFSKVTYSTLVFIVVVFLLCTLEFTMADDKIQSFSDFVQSLSSATFDEMRRFKPFGEAGAAKAAPVLSVTFVD